MQKILIIAGTRPEAIKLAPVILTLQKEKYTKFFEVIVCATGQHRQMLDQVFNLFNIKTQRDLNIMQENQSPAHVASRVFAELEPILKNEKPAWTLIQGDTTTVMAAAVASFYAGIKIGHVEAGLRSFDTKQPFPEEINRRVASVVADLHFAPTEWAKKNLVKEGLDENAIRVTGNTVIDALNRIIKIPLSETVRRLFSELGIDEEKKPEKKIILVTAHRRENFGKPFEKICEALKHIAETNKKYVTIVYPVHLNPNVWEPAHRFLGGVKNIKLTRPVDYLSLVHLMKKAHIIITDSGGIQEEAPGLGKPVLVLREVTERPEGVHAGVVKLVGTDPDKIVRESFALIHDENAYQKMAQAVNPYGDGLASERIAKALVEAGI